MAILGIMLAHKQMLGQRGWKPTASVRKEALAQGIPSHEVPVLMLSLKKKYEEGEWLVFQSQDCLDLATQVFQAGKS